MTEDKSDVPAFGSEIRKEFMLRENSVFLNHGSYGSMPRCAHERQVRYLAEMESHPDTWFRYNMYKYLYAAKAKVADFMGVHADDIFLLQNVTKGAKVVNMDIKFPLMDEDSVVEMYEAFLTKHPEVKLAVVDHITSPTAVLLPVKRITEVCHRHDVIVIIDAAHAPGQLHVDIQDIDADFYTGNLHKWLYCPRACAFIWMNPNRKHPWFKPLVTSAFDNDSLHDAFAYEGTKDDTPYICTMNGIDYYNRIGGMEKVVGYNTALLKQGVAYLEEKWGVKRLEIPDAMEAPCLRVLHLPFIAGITDRMDLASTDVFKGKVNLGLQRLILDKYDIQVAVVVIQGKLMVRVCAQVYNTMDDFIRLGDAVLDLTQQENDITCYSDLNR